MIILARTLDSTLTRKQDLRLLLFVCCYPSIFICMLFLPGYFKINLVFKHTLYNTDSHTHFSLPSEWTSKICV
jgi:hypothetical protein